MVLPNSFEDREYQKFVDTEPGPSVRVTGVSGEMATESTLSAIYNELYSTTGTVTATAFSMAVQTVMFGNVSRRGFFLYNDSNKRVLIKLGSGASASSFSFVLGAGDLYERELTNYRGEITAIWDSPASGSLYATELS